MSIRYYLLAASILLLLAGPDRTRAQGVTESSSAFEPLAVGFEWEYEAYFGSLPNRPYWSRLERRAIVGDTLIEGRLYFVDQRQRFTDHFHGPVYEGPSTALVRFDPDRQHRVRWNGEADVPDGLGCPLDAANGSVVVCAGALQMQATRNGDHLGFADLVGAEHGASYLRGVGRDREGNDYVTMRLFYAAVGDASFGTPRFVSAVSTEDVHGDPAVSSAGAPYPNPMMEGAVSIPLYSRTPGTVTVDVYDGLGRHVVQTSHRASGGRGAVALDGSSWAPGLYTLRLHFPDGEVDVRRVVRAR
jgi:hypothetical protein